MALICATLPLWLLALLLLSGSRSESHGIWLTLLPEAAEGAGSAVGAGSDATGLVGMITRFGLAGSGAGEFASITAPTFSPTWTTA
ncbi:hypothetical protein D3C76_1154070 [compost metagenome]